ncbi:MAG TPA: hypothetical protein VFP84_05325 [Kofleriaceae bacterium]|nr:hypothetical protein [Kofleriaceae bacterium]
MRARDVVTLAFAAAAGCGAPPGSPVLSGSAPHVAPVASAPSEPAPPPPAGLTADERRCPVFPIDCLVSLDAHAAADCPAPAPPVITFAANSAIVPRAARPMLDRVVHDSRWFADDTRVVLSADAARIEPPELAEQRVAAVRQALIARGLRGRGIVTVATSVEILDAPPAPPSNRVEIALRGCR